MKWVVIITACTMVAEIVVGRISGSMALLADGWHMGTSYVELETYKYQVEALNRVIRNRISAGQDPTRFQEQRTNILKKTYENPYSKITTAGGGQDILPLTGADS